MNSNSINEILLKKMDAWRGLLALVVCFSHCFQLLSPTSWQNEYLMNILGDLAQSAVLAFFFLSGYVIFMSLELKLISTNRIDVKQFTISRFARIFPPFIFSIVLCYLFKFSYKVVAPSFKAYYIFDFSYKDALYNIGMLKLTLGVPNAPIWSLIIEWWCYFIGFFLFAIIHSKNMANSIFHVILIILIGYHLYNINSNFFVYLLTWLLGMLFWYFQTNKSLKLTVKILGIISFILFIFLKYIYYSATPISEIWFLKLFAVFIFASVLELIPESNILEKMAKFSYSLYIIHYPIFLYIAGTTILLKVEYMLPFIFFGALIFVIILAKYSALLTENKNLFLQILKLKRP